MSLNPTPTKLLPPGSIGSCLKLISTVVLATNLLGCMKPEPDAANTKDASIRSAVPLTVIVILAHQPDPKSNVLTLQDYFRDGQAFIPMFRSKESLLESTRGGVDKPTYEIDRRLFVSMLRGPETVILDVATSGEVVTSGAELKRVFPEPLPLPREKPTK